MKVLTSQHVFAALCKERKQWGLFLNFDAVAEWDEVEKTVPFLSGREYIGFLIDGEAFILCDSKEECQHLYDQVVGDDGHTKLNPYNGRAKTYALTISDDGLFMNENT